MNELSETTSPELIPIITALYDCLFDKNKRFTSLQGFEEVVDSGIVKFKGVEDSRKLNFKYKGKKYELALFNYIRDNGNTIGIRNGETDSNFIQYVLDKFIQIKDTSIEFNHDGVITGSSGKTKEACIDEILKYAPHLIKVDGKNRYVTLGNLETGYQFEDKDFQKLIANFIEYSILRNNFKNNLTSNGFSNFKEAVEGYRIHLSNNPIVNARFKLNKCNKIYVWVPDIINDFTNEECHYELIVRDNNKISIELHFEEKNKKNYLKRLKDHLPELVYLNSAHKAGISFSYDKAYPYDDLDLFTKIDEGLLYLNEHLGDRIRKIKTTKYSIQEIEKMFKDYLDKTVDAPKTASAYFSAIPRINKIGLNLELLDESLYELQDSTLLSQFNNAIVRDESYKEINKTSNRGPSSALKKYREFIIDHFTTTLQETSTDEPMSLNQILYGPPGTGKTYNTINKALEIINDAEVQTLDWNNREEVKELFDKKVKEGQIVFTTFHQNMSYEDFIEGIKPKKTDEGKVFYDIEKGVFKKLCEKASEKQIKSNNFSEIYALLLKEIDEAPENKLVLETLAQSKEYTIYKNSKDNIRFHANTEKAYEGVIKKEVLEHYLKTGEALDWPSYTKSLSKYIVDKFGYSQSEESVDKKFVIIIDEINRGNVSKIFGELITLIEDSKRAGKSEAITALLPYSKEEFSVPDNVYILGTMNTADRSVEALDTALRRRFDFIEMMPKYDLYKRNDLKYFLNGMFAFDILKTINDRLEVLLGRDHLIGHSFFILDENESIEPKVKSAFYKNIIPLLQEYFYGDYNKIGLVLGSGFVKKNEVAKAKELFANNREFSGDDYANNAHTFEIIDYTDTTKYTTNSEFYVALNTLMNKIATSDENA